MLSVVMLNVVAPNGYLKPTFFHVHPTNPDAKLTKLNPVKKAVFKEIKALPESIYLKMKRFTFSLKPQEKKMHESPSFSPLKMSGFKPSTRESLLKGKAEFGCPPRKN